MMLTSDLGRTLLCYLVITGYSAFNYRLFWFIYRYAQWVFYLLPCFYVLLGMAIWFPILIIELFIGVPLSATGALFVWLRHRWAAANAPNDAVDNTKVETLADAFADKKLGLFGPTFPAFLEATLMMMMATFVPCIIFNLLSFLGLDVMNAPRPTNWLGGFIYDYKITLGIGLFVTPNVIAMLHYVFRRELAKMKMC